MVENEELDKLTLNELLLHNANVQEPTSDWLLRYLADQANQSDLQMGITLQVDGMLVSGTLVGGQAYFDAVTKDISTALGGKEDSKALAELFERMNRVLHSGANPDTPKPTPAYIHLKGARFFQAADAKPIPGNQGIWWRGRLSQISGFFFGNLSA